MPKIVDHDQYRKELLHKSFDLFAEKGYAITMRQIAQGLGVSTGTLYHYFPSKENLFEQLVMEQSDRDLSLVAKELQQVHTLPERLEVAFQFLESHQDYFFKQMMIWMDFSQHQNREGKACSEILEQLEEKLYAAIAELLEVNDPDLIGLIASFIDGLIVGGIYNTPISISRQGQLFTKMLMTYLESNPLPSR